MPGKIGIGFALAHFMGLLDVIGILGVGCYLVAYFLLQTKAVDAQDLRYHTLNAGGAIFMIISLFGVFHLASLISNVCWLTITIFGAVSQRYSGGSLVTRWKRQVR